MIRFFMPTGACLTDRSRSLRCKAMRSPRTRAWPTSQSGVATMTRRSVGAREPSNCASRSKNRFWMQDLQYYGIALDGEGKLCRIRASNAGHLLFVGLPTQDRGRAVARQLAGGDFASGWGLRTLASGQMLYNPMSYHNGSVWPHDTALCIAGLRRYGAIDAVIQLLSGMWEAAAHFDMRLPELFCGFARAGAESPVAYPVACLPQAWAAASTFGMLQACLGVTVDGWS